MFQKKEGENLDPTQEQILGFIQLNALANNFTKSGVAYLDAQMKSVENLAKMDKDMSSLVKNMGVTTQYSQLLKQELGRAVTEVTLMGGKQSDINLLQKEFLEATNRTIVLSSENIENLYAVSQVSGVAVKTLETAFRNAGMETTHISEEMKTVYHTANSLGVNAQAVSSMVVANLDKMNRFGFGNGIEGMAKMAAKAASMRVDMNQTLNLADKLFSPEAAMDVAATLQRLGATSGALLDPLKLMDLAQNNVPELQNQLSELSKTFTKFDEKTGKFQIMPEARRQLGEVASALGIDRNEFEKMALESAKMEKKLGEINFRPLGNISEDEKMMIANLAEFNKAKGDYTVKFTSADGKVLEKTLGDLTEADKEALKNQQNLVEPQKELVDIAKEQLGATNTLVAQDAALSATIQTQFAINLEGTKYLQALVETQKTAFKPGFESYSLDKNNKNEFGDKIFGALTDIQTGKVQPEDLKSEILKILGGNYEQLTSMVSKEAELISQNPLNASLGTISITFDTVDTKLKSFGINLGEVYSDFRKGTAFIAPILTGLGKVFGVDLGTNSNEQTVNPQAATNGGVPNSNSNSNNNTTPTPTPLPANNNTSQVREIKHTIELTVKAETNNPEVNTAVLKALDNDDTLRVLRENIAKVASDYGLTAV
jgi:hypothetical protein